MIERDFQAVFASLPSDGWLSEPEARLLLSAAEQTTGHIVEVGSYQGRSSVLLASLGRHLHCVDPWDDAFHSELKGETIFARFLENMRPFRGSFSAYRMPVEVWLPIEAGLVYLDGDHTYEGTVAQVQQALLCKPQIIAIHDVNDSGDGLLIQEAAVKLLGPWHKRAERLAVWDLRK